MPDTTSLVDPGYHFIWIIWSAALLVPWLTMFIARPRLRRRMLWASTLTAPFGLTEPLFVPAYRNPPSLFDLAQRTGFDIQSLVFCFASGGLAAAGYRSLAQPRRSGNLRTHDRRHHRFHAAALASPFVMFAVLLPLPWNPIYAGIASLLTGAVSTLACRPDLTRNTLVGGVLMLLFYVVFLLGLRVLWPSYIEAVWNLPELMPWRPAGLPLEELLFGFGMYWSSVYEHVTWRRNGEPMAHPPARRELDAASRRS